MNEELSEELFKIGKGLFTSRKYSEALSFFEQSLKKNNNKPGTWFMMGQCHGNMRNFQKALFCFEKALSINPNLSIVWDAKSHTLERLGYSEKEVKECTQKAKDLGWNRNTPIKMKEVIPNKDNIPKLFRYMNKKWVDNFFETGELRIPTLKKCKTHEDEIRQDEDDGTFFASALSNDDGILADNSGLIFRYNDEQGNPIRGVRMFTKLHTKNCFLFCTSEEGSSRLMSHFNTDSLFTITQLSEFMEILAQAIEEQIKLENNIHIGRCFYLEKGPMPSDLRMAMRNRDFVKNFKFAHEREWRIIYYPANQEDIKEDYITVKCPKAIQFCQKINPDELNF